MSKCVLKYGLFERPIGERRWNRIYPELAFRKEVAVVMFQNRLLEPMLTGMAVERSLRPCESINPAFEDLVDRAYEKVIKH